MTDGPFFISPAGSDQLHQDLEGVDEHRPNLLTSSRPTRQNKPRTRTSLMSSKVTTTKVMDFFLKTFFFFIQAWLSYIFFEFFKVDLPASRASDRLNSINL